jgi:UPF0271 protein
VCKQRRLFGEKAMATKGRIDLNADVGESFGVYKLGLDEEVMPLISSANIACGFHAGDPAVMRRTITLARKHGVAAGAHPGLPDLLSFGRRYMDASLGEIKDYLIYQIGALQATARMQGLKLQHVKPHGALYNMAVQNVHIWETAAEVIAGLDKDLILVALAGPKSKEVQAIGTHYGIRIALEFFADRTYNPNGSLVSRQDPDAIIQDHHLAAKRVLKMATEGKVIAKGGREISLEADTVCVHGDNPAAVALARKIREMLASAGIGIAPLGAFL